MAAAALLADPAIARAPTAPAKTRDPKAAQAAARDFEGFFIARLIEQMFAGIRTDGPLGGGFAEPMYRSLMINQYGKVITRAGGLGLADPIARTLLSAQENASP